MPNLGASSGGRVPRRPKSMGSCNEKNAEHFTVAGKSKSTTPPVRDGLFHAREEFESRPNNLDFYDWQPGSSSMDNGCQMKKRNEEREQGKWSYLPRSYGSSEEGAELGSRKVVNRQMTQGQRATVATPGATGLSSSYQQHQQLTLSDSDEPDSEQLLGQLVRLQNSIKQASVMLDKIMLLPEPQRSEQKGHLLSILRQLKEEEHGYKVLLRGILASREVDESLRRSDVSGNGLSGLQPDIGRTLPRDDEEDLDEHENVSKPNNRDKFRPHFPVVMSDSQNEIAQFVAADDQGSTVAGSEASTVSMQRHQLQKKLHTLQEKKQQMDDLLEKLQQLKSDQMLLDNGQHDDATIWSVMSSMRASSSADRTAEDAEQMLVKMETRQKLKKLEAMRAQLDQLRALTQFYQTGDNGSVPVDDDGLMGENSSHEDSAEEDEHDVDEEEAFISSLRPMRTRPDRMLSGDNRDEPVLLNSSTHSQDHERQNGTDAVSSESLVQRIDGASAVAEKMRELEAAGDKLRRLQELVAMVQQSGFSEEVGVAVSELEDAVDNSEAGDHLDEDTEDKDHREDEEFYSRKMQKQQKELQELMSERQRLLKLQADLDKIQENLPHDSVADEGQQIGDHGTRVRHPLDGRWVTRDKRVSSATASLMKRTVVPPVGQETSQVTFQEPLESVVSNEEVYDQMRWQQMMREEQREKKKLGGRVNGDGAPKRSSANQDGRSEGTSTYRSDQYSRTSPSEDVTMATWGGSTAGNLESIEENENRSNNETGDDDADDGDNEKDDDDDEDESGDNLLQVEEEEEEEEALNNDEYDEEDFYYDDDDVPDVAPTRKWRQKPANDDNVRVPVRYNNQPSFVKMPQKQRTQGLSTVQESIHSLRKQMAQLSSAVKKSITHKRHENNANSSEQTAQLQLNQLFLGLNQSYFQLTATQNNLMERFNRLEQLVLTTQNEGLATAHGFYPADQDLSKQTPSPFQVMAPAWNQVGSPARSGSLSLDPGPANHNQGAINFMAGTSSSGQQVSPAVSTRPATGCFYGSAYSPRESREVASSMGRKAAERNNGRYVISSDFQDSGMAGDPRMLKSPSRFDSVDEVVIRQQSSGDARAFAMAHLASQKVVDAKGDDQRFLRTIADDASVSSVPGSCIELARKTTEKATGGESGGGSFDRQSDEIYSEVASLISQNEHCPDFLVQLFRKLQCLSTDFLRQRALYALQDLVSRTPPAEPELRFEFEPGHQNMGAGQPGMIPLRRHQLGMEDGTGMSSEQSTPSPCNTSQWENPFESDPLGDTVIHFDKMMQAVRETELKMAEARQASSIHTPNTRDAAAAGGGSDAAAAAGGSLRWANSSDRRQSKTDLARAPPVNEKGSDGSISDDTCPRINAHQLDQQIKEIMMEVIPVIKEHISGICSQQFLQYIEDLVMSLVRQTDQTQPEFERFFRRQLATILKDSLAKFKGRKILDCGEDLLVNLSEILFNELAFFRLMQNLGTSKAKVKLLTLRKDSPDILSSEAIQKQRKNSSSSVSESGESTDLDSVDAEKETNNAVELVDAVSAASAIKDRKRQRDDVKYFGLSDTEREKDAVNRDGESAMTDEFIEEDEYYTENMKFFHDNESIDDSFSMDESLCNSNVKIELAPSETKPFTRIGSDEDDEAADEAASADDPYETAVSRDAEKERCSKASTSSVTSSSTSMERESSHKGSMEKEEKERDTQEMAPVTTEADGGNTSGPVQCESESGLVVEPVDEVPVVNNELSDARADKNVEGVSTVEPDSVPMV